MSGSERAAQGAAPHHEDEISDSEVDLNLEETFPASDPPSWTLGTDHGEKVSLKPGTKNSPTPEPTHADNDLTRVEDGS